MFLVTEASLKEASGSQSMLQWVLEHDHAIESLLRNYKDKSFELKDPLLLKQFREYYGSSPERKVVMDKLNQLFKVNDLPTPYQRMSCVSGISSMGGMTPNPEIRNLVNKKDNETSINEGMNESKAG